MKHVNISITLTTPFVKAHDKEFSERFIPTLKKLIEEGVTFSLVGPSEADLLRAEPEPFRASCVGLPKREGQKEWVSAMTVSHNTIYGAYRGLMRGVKKYADISDE